MYLVVAVYFIITTSALAQFTRSIVADSVANSGAVWYAHQRNVARTSDLSVAWQDLVGGQIVSSIYDDISLVWLPPVQISSAGNEADKVALISDYQGRIHAVWQQRLTSGSKWEIYHAINFGGGFWGTPFPVSQDPILDAEECSIEIDSNGDIVVVWNTDNEADGDEWILFSRSSDDGANWSVPDTLSSPDGIIGGTSTNSGRVALWAGSNGRVVATWHEDYPPREREVHVNQYDGSNWSGEIVISDTMDTVVVRTWYPNVVMDSQDNIYIVYATDVSGTDPRHLLFAKKSWSGQWTMPYDTLYTETGSDFLANAITIDQNGGIYVGFRRSIPGDTLGQEEVAYITSADGGATWSSVGTLSRPNHDAGYLTFVGHVGTGAGVDAVWRESFHEGIDDDPVISVLYAEIDLVTGIEDNPLSYPIGFTLRQNYPNPFNPTTTIKYTISNAGVYDLDIYNILGEKIRTVVASHLTAGEYVAEWDGKDDAGIAVASGVYFYRLSGDNLTLAKKMILMR
jgi:hypothetical protein